MIQVLSANTLPFYPGTMYYLLTNISGSTLTLEDLNEDGIKKEAQEKIAKSRGSMAWLHFANVPGDPTSAVCNSCQVGATLHIIHRQSVRANASSVVKRSHLNVTHIYMMDNTVTNACKVSFVQRKLTI